MVVNGSLSKTAVNGAAGARTQVSGLVVAVLTLITLLFLTGLFEQLPEATLSAVVIAAVDRAGRLPGAAPAVPGVDRRGWAGSTGSRRASISSPPSPRMLGVLIFDTLPGLVIGIVVSMLLLLYRVSRPHVARPGRARTAPGWTRSGTTDCGPIRGILVVRVESGLFFANSDHVRDRIEALRTPETRVVVLDAETSPFLDVSAAEMLGQLAASLRRDGSRAADRP